MSPAGKNKKWDKKDTKQVEKKLNRTFFIAAGIIGIVTGLIFGYKLKWAGDDIFIGLRYIENFLTGHGLVYNIGERIEGYTNFLWLMMVAFFQYLKFDPVESSLNLGLFFTLGTLLLAGYISFRINAGKGLKYLIPLALLMLAVNFDFAVWATSGLETMFYTFLLLSAFACYFFSDSKRNKRLFITGLILCLGLLTRPDAALLFMLASAFLLIRNSTLKASFKQLFTEQLLFSTAVLLIYIPYYIWRYKYFGQVFPNTYYAKAGYLSFYRRGFFYLWLYVQCHFTTFLFLLSIPVLIRSFIHRQEKGASSLRSWLLSVINDRSFSAFTVAVICVALYLVFFVARVGGDFMYARFIIPCLPFIYFIIEYSLHALPAIKYPKRYMLITLLLISCGIAESKIREGFFLEEDNGQVMAMEKEGIADERYVYLYQYSFDMDKKIGIALRPYFQGLDATVLTRGGQACFVYYGKFQYCLENYGLTDTVISHLPIKERGGKIAHEKSAPYEYMIKRGVNFVFTRSAYKNDPYRFCQFNLLDLGFAERAEIITYNRKLIKALTERLGDDFIYTNFETYLDNYIQNSLPGKSKEEIRKDYEAFKEYYFLHNDDSEREKMFLSRI